VQERVTRRPLAILASGLLLCVSTAATDLVAAPNEAAAPKEGAAAGLADWRRQMVERIDDAKTFPASGYCKQGVVRVSMLIDRAGNLLSSEIAESSSIPAFDVEALAILKRAHPFPPPPEGVGGAFVTVSVPIRFTQAPEGSASEKLLYLTLKSDSTLTLDGAPVQSNGLDRSIGTATSNDKNARIIICSDDNVPAEQVSNLAEQVKAAGFKFTVAPRADSKSD
jgi:TonB family protein